MSKVFPVADVAVAPGESLRQFELAPGWSLQASSVFGSEADPGLAGFLWARRPEVVTLIMEGGTAAQLTGEGPEFPEPGTDIVGFAPLTFAAALQYEKAAGRRPRRSAAYAVPEGAFRYSKIIVSGRDYVFADANPEPGDEIIGILFQASA